MRLQKKVLICYWLLLWSSLFAFSQTKKPLDLVLKSLEKNHDLKFSFLTKSIINVLIYSPDEKLSIPEKIKFIEQQTQLVFSFVDENYIIISEKTIAKSKNIDTIVKVPFRDSLAFVLNEVAILNFLTKGIYKKNDGSFVIKTNKLATLPGITENDVLQSIQQIPGVYSKDESISNINIRGGTHDQNLFSWNNIPMYQTGHFYGLIAAFNPVFPEHVQVIKNGTSAFLGNSVSGTVLTHTNVEKIDKNQNCVVSNLLSTAVGTQFKIGKKINFQITARRSLTDFFPNLVYEKYRDRVFQNTTITNVDSKQKENFSVFDDFYFYDFNLSNSIKISEKTTAGFNFIQTKNNLKINQTTTESAEENFLKQDNLGASVFLNHRFLNNQISSNFYVSDYQLVSNSEKNPDNVLFFQTNKIKEFGAKFNFKHSFSDHFLASLGYHFQKNQVENSDLNNKPAFSRTQFSGLNSHIMVAEFELNTHKKWQIITGFRANYWADFKKFATEPRLNISYKPNNVFRFNLLAEQKSQILSQIIELQSDFLGLEKRRWQLANNNSIPVQQSRQIDLSFSFNKKNWLLTIENFYKSVNGISSNSQSFQNQIENQSLIGKYDNFGTEILLQKSFSKFTTWMSYCFNSNFYTFDNFEPQRFKNNFNLTHTFAFATIYNYEKWNLSLGFRLTQGLPYTDIAKNQDVNTTQIFYENPNAAKLPVFFQTNFSGSYTFNFSSNNKLQLGFAVLNVLNSKNITNTYFRKNQDYEIEKIDVSGFLFTPNVFVKYWF
jgi:hypothetical protein